MIMASTIEAYRQDHGTDRQHVAITDPNGSGHSIHYEIDANGNAVLNQQQLKEFLCSDNVNIGLHEQGDVELYLCQVAEGTQGVW